MLSLDNPSYDFPIANRNCLSNHLLTGGFKHSEKWLRKSRMRESSGGHFVIFVYSSRIVVRTETKHYLPVSGSANHTIPREFLGTGDATWKSTQAIQKAPSLRNLANIRIGVPSVPSIAPIAHYIQY